MGNVQETGSLGVLTYPMSVKVGVLLAVLLINSALVFGAGESGYTLVGEKGTWEKPNVASINVSKFVITQNDLVIVDNALWYFSEGNVSWLGNANNIDIGFAFGKSIVGRLDIGTYELYNETFCHGNFAPNVTTCDTVQKKRIVWTDRTNLIQHTEYNGKHHYFITNIAAAKNQLFMYRIRIKNTEVAKGESLKYDVEGKFTADTVATALSTGRYVALDPHIIYYTGSELSQAWLRLRFEEGAGTSTVNESTAVAFTLADASMFNNSYGVGNGSYCLNVHSTGQSATRAGGFGVGSTDQTTWTFDIKKFCPNNIATQKQEVILLGKGRFEVVLSPNSDYAPCSTTAGTMCMLLRNDDGWDYLNTTGLMENGKCYDLRWEMNVSGWYVYVNGTLNWSNPIHDGWDEGYGTNQGIGTGVASITSGTPTYYRGTMDDVLYFPISLGKPQYEADSTTLTISAPLNNATATTRPGYLINWTAIVTGSGTLDRCWFTHNNSGSWVNKTFIACSSPFSFSDNVSITVTEGQNVCGFFGANDTIGTQATSSQSCFTMPDLTSPTFTSAANNASSSVINDVINWSVNIADGVGLHSVTFSENSTGNWVNDTPIRVSGTGRAVNVTHAEISVANRNVCGRFYFNDTTGNQNMSQSCYVSPDLNRLNLSLRSRTGSVLVFWANLTNSSGAVAYNGSVSTAAVLLQVRSDVYNVTLNTSSFGSVTFLLNVTNHLNSTAYIPNITYAGLPSSVVSTQSATFTMIMSQADDFQYSGVQLIFNNTNFSTTRTEGGGMVNYTSSIVIPTISVFNPAMPYFWNYTLKGKVNSTETKYVFVNIPNLVNCSGGDINQSINFSIYNEDFPTEPLISAVEVEFNLGNEVNRQLLNLSYTLNGSSSYAFCVGNASFQADAYFKYTSVNGYTHRYYFFNQSLSNVTKTFRAYNFDNTNGKTALKFNVRDADSFSQLPNIVVSLQRRYTGEGIWRTVQMDKSGAFGENNFNIIEKTMDYRFILHDTNNTLLKETTMAKIICEATPCQLTVLVSTTPAEESEVQLGFSYVYNVTTRFITMTWNDPTNNADTVRVRISKETFSNSIMICDATFPGSSGTTTCNMSVYEPPYRLEAITTASPPEMVFSSMIGDMNMTFVNSMGGVQNSAFIVGITTILTGVAGVTMGVVAATAMLIVGLLAGLFFGSLKMLTIPLIVTLGIVTIFITIKMRGKYG